MRSDHEVPAPVLGFCAPSGTGKTTLLTRVIPRLAAAGLRVAVVKHTHHRPDLDTPGKDSHRLQQAGVERLVIASRRQLALLCNRPDDGADESLAASLALLASDNLDLVLVEGFAREPVPRIELHRRCVGGQLAYPTDERVIAVAADWALPAVAGRKVAFLDIDRCDLVAAFVIDWLRKGAIPRSSAREA